MTFFEKLETTVKQNNSLLCIGLDADIHRIPKHLLESNDPIFDFNKAIIDSTYDLVCAYKPNSAFYEADGIDGIASLEKTIEYIYSTYPDIPVILDFKRGDISSTSEHYALAAFDYLKVDAVTLSPYLGLDSLEPYLKRTDKGIFILCRTSNPGASDFQDLEIDGVPLFAKVAEKVMDWHTTYANCSLVVGATWPEQIKQVRTIAPDMWLLVPGVGAQGGELDLLVEAGLRSDHSGLIINASRSIIYAGSGDDFADIARQEAQILYNKINKHRNN